MLTWVINFVKWNTGATKYNFMKPPEISPENFGEEILSQLNQIEDDQQPLAQINSELPPQIEQQERQIINEISKDVNTDRASDYLNTGAAVSQSKSVRADKMRPQPKSRDKKRSPKKTGPKIGTFV